MNNSALNLSIKIHFRSNLYDHTKISRILRKSIPHLQQKKHINIYIYHYVFLLHNTIPSIFFFSLSGKRDFLRVELIKQTIGSALRVFRE